MAPLSSRHLHAPLISRPSKASSAGALKVLLELFVGTICIFVLAVLFWKLGRFFRAFTKGKVLKQGNLPTTRYAKTWYGWVSLKQHEANKNFFRNVWCRIRKLSSWRSSKADYQWVWWDPGQKNFETYNEKRTALRCLPKRARSYASLPIPEHIRSVVWSRQSIRHASICMEETRGSSLSARTVITHTLEITDISSNPIAPGTAPVVLIGQREFMSLDESVCFVSAKRIALDLGDYIPLIPQSFSVPCLPRPVTFSGQSHIRSNTSSRPKVLGAEEAFPTCMSVLQCSRKYQIWSARMGLQTLQCIGYSTHTLPRPPPGSPRSTLLRRKQPPRAATKAAEVPSYALQIRYLSNWEIRLIDGLNRKLNWLSDQLSPGRRPFHFALLANHWLNKETWIVYDPASRTNIDTRRKLGDPRFNVPYPAANWAPKLKYSRTYHKPAHTPNINSWRDSINRNRRASGLKDLIKGIDLYDSSIEDPPDGKVDPACWMLRKPPQGFHLSAHQKERYYEGGAGWQEKLNDWQKVRRGYRIRKGIFEGKANRTRAKEIANGINRYYRMARSRAQRSESPVST
ncbi:hypothetical protein P175DRAFT_0483334 [Aspergillus ochraceoroseus IBT 24754]|uniref:Uncharacterized protein n=1 Tax=Aspergillus ochraceoroseus IBT 24754 TaxID=1392256 RepID=A0A2T5LTP3_9EURO|nr:uncharacterized protein P175DRAFT_0483334 [Aspergillus ochraceoroseus IBT 24754]PTU19661.1 hypothetical protein P175DRAFT_0483334 [Aspergillus ochraceoroseus IBT 24754]